MKLQILHGLPLSLQAFCGSVVQLNELVSQLATRPRENIFLLVTIVSKAGSKSLDKSSGRRPIVCYNCDRAGHGMT